MTLPTEVNLLAVNQSGYQISRSVRTRSIARGFFNRTPAVVGNRQKWTWSGWVKKSGQAVAQTLFSAGTATDRFAIGYGGADVLNVTNLVASVTTIIRQTNAIYRDPSAWYHVVLAVDTTQATAANRTYLAVNGVQITSFLNSNDLALNYQTFVNNTVAHNISAVVGGTNNVDGYLTEINFIDGQALPAASFGGFNGVTGVWQAKEYTGTYGTNGYHLNFSDNSAATAATIGKDYSGNGNNWTPNNISVTAGVTYDSMLDVPLPYINGGNNAGNYCSLNPLDKTTATVVSDGTLSLGLPANVAGGCGSTFAISSGQWYCEVKPSSGSNLAIGIVLASLTQNGANSLFATGYAYYQFNGNKYVNSVATAYGATYTTADVIGIAVDFTALTITFYKNNVSQGAISIAAGSYKFTAANGSSTVSQSCGYNFGQRPFTYTPPTGFNALNTQNLPDATIVNGANYMAATLYTGTTSTLTTVNNAVNGVSFQPDFVWVKARSSATVNVLANSVSGNNLYLSSDTTAAEAAINVQLTSNGFTTSATSTALNGTGINYVGWQWKAGGAAVTNTTGTITSQVSANTSAGFSALEYTGNGVVGATVGHGLGVAPSMIFVKSLGVNNWPVFHIGNVTPARDIFYLNQTAAVAVNTNFWNNVLPSSSVITLGTNNHVNLSATNYLAYCWAVVEGYSAFGKYTGNGLADGPFVYTGFRPRWIMVRYANAIANWLVWDTSRNTFNVVGEELYPNLTTIGTVGTDLDILSNGFKIRNTTASFNTSAGLFVYAAFAENPFKNALAR